MNTKVRDTAWWSLLAFHYIEPIYTENKQIKTTLLTVSTLLLCLHHSLVSVYNKYYSWYTHSGSHKYFSMRRPVQIYNFGAFN